MTGFLIPPWYKNEVPADTEMNIASVIFGFSLGAALFTAAKAFEQSLAAYRRGRLFTAYIIMCWLEWIGFVFWSMQIQFILQIIINRISLLVANKSTINKIKWGVAIIVSLINLSGFCIWVPARLQISHLYEDINVIWDRTEKAVFLIVDLALNLYFIYLVRSRLLAYGLTKYTQLFHFNVAMVFVSVTLDCILMGATFLPSPVVYVQFHQLTYLLKLYIEMNVAGLLGHIVKKSKEHDGMRGNAGRYAPKTHDDLTNVRMATLITANRNGHVRLADGSRTDDYERGAEWGGIHKQVETQIVFTNQEDHDHEVSEASSETKVLK
ncbi:glutathione s-transferase [Fusarium albosuccineum]|uniref:Glutathione s-transferase n=1 Tax=Fusarium albosuccineum TaxID=1237068 RepID=A0A8H4LA98_9HYPO|nr:glutathione s-transferase [Fusarium albosuccineum]